MALQPVRPLLSMRGVEFFFSVAKTLRIRETIFSGSSFPIFAGTSYKG